MNFGTASRTLDKGKPLSLLLLLFLLLLLLHCFLENTLVIGSPGILEKVGVGEERGVG